MQRVLSIESTAKCPWSKADIQIGEHRLKFTLEKDGLLQAYMPKTHYADMWQELVMWAATIEKPSVMGLAMMMMIMITQFEYRASSVWRHFYPALGWNSLSKFGIVQIVVVQGNEDTESKSNLMNLLFVFFFSVCQTSSYGCITGGLSLSLLVNSKCAGEREGETWSIF